ncbi:MAG TPA: enoyl-CoA hydratase [Acidimicrobiales bacterium]
MISSERHGPVAVVILDRPEARNALTGAMTASLADALADADADPDVAAIVLTGRDPAFCSGLDLTDLATTYDDVAATPRADGTSDRRRARRGLMPDTTTPVIGAVNGPAVTGGLELALGCDFLIASERATFADTHARVGVLPAGGMTIRLPQLIGINRARQMSLTGNFVDAATAWSWGLVNEVVSHDELLPRSLELGRAIAESDPAVIGEVRSMYDTLAHRGDGASYEEEARRSRRWMKERFDPAAFRSRRDGIITRGSSQQEGGQAGS